MILLMNQCKVDAIYFCIVYTKSLFILLLLSSSLSFSFVLKGKSTLCNLYFLINGRFLISASITVFERGIISNLYLGCYTCFL